ncbi:MAG: thioredoxin domain-containing protein [Acidobacteria bacterium]|nr:thioredoxin domain-containing protein [Acidobacteriota bacterium]
MAIQWRDWSPRAFEQAEAGKKPVLLSLVTAWSDGCAAMDQTTYANQDVVSLINTGFVPVRVDADRRPDVNERYNLGGWPTTAFLTSAGEILSGGTYMTADRMIAMLQYVADTCRTRASEIAERAASLRLPPSDAHPVRLPPDRDPIEHFRALLVERFDRVHGGFGSSPKLPHPCALLFALSAAGDSGDVELSQMADVTLDRMGALWDPVAGGFYRYADAEDWSRPGTEKTLEDNAALLHVYVEAAVRGRSGLRDRAAAIVRWVKGVMADQARGGFYNAQALNGIDARMYIDRNAMMVGAFIRAAALFDDVWLRDFALKSLEAVVVPAYQPGDGVAHVGPEGAAPPVRGLLTDQVHVASALIWAHAATGQLPYSMLAAELMQFAVRQMWNERTGTFRDRTAPDDPITPFELNCQAACVLDRLASLTGNGEHRARAQMILRALDPEYRGLDLFGAPYALAVREVIGGCRPAGLELTKVDWQLG